MALSVPGVVAMVFFYILVLGVGIWASFKSRKKEKKNAGDRIEMSLLANRSITWVVGIFTMSGEFSMDLEEPCSDRVLHVLRSSMNHLHQCDQSSSSSSCSHVYRRRLRGRDQRDGLHPVPGPEMGPHSAVCILHIFHSM